MIETNIASEIKKMFIGKWIKCYQWIDDWNDVVYTLEQPSELHQITLKQIRDIKLNHTVFTISFEEDGYIDIYVTDDFELHDDQILNK